MIRNRSLPRGPVVKYYLYMATISQGLVVPVMILLMLERGLTFTHIGIIDAIFMVTWVLAEVPTGYVGDRVGRRNSLIASSLLIAGAILLMGFSHSFLSFAVANVAWAVGVTFRSGTGDAWLYDVLADRLEEDEFARVRGNGQSTFLAVKAGTSVLAGYLVVVGWAVPFVLNAALVGLSALVVLTFPRSGRHADAEDDGRFTVLDALPLIRNAFTRPPLRTFVLYVAALFGLIEVTLTFVQPIATDVGLAVVHLGWLYAGFAAVSAVASYFSGDVKERLGIKGWFLSAPFLLAGLFVAMSVLPVVAIPAFFVMNAVQNVSTPLRSQFLNDRIGSVGRATVLSAVGMVSALSAAGTRLAGGVLADFIGPIDTVAIFGGLFVVVAGLLVAIESPFGRAHGRSAAAETD